MRRKMRMVEITTLCPPPYVIKGLRDTSKVILPPAISARTSTGFHDTHLGHIHHDEYGFMKIQKKTDGRCFIDNMKKYVELTQKYGVGKFHLYLQKVYCGGSPKPFVHIAVVVVQGKDARYIDVSNGAIEIYNFTIKLAGFRENSDKFYWGLIDLGEEILDLFKEKRSAIDYDKLCYRVSNACYTSWTDLQGI